LAGRAPGSPKIKKDDLTFLVFNVSETFTHLLVDADLISISDDSHLVALASLALDLDFKVVTSKGIDSFLKSINFVFHGLTDLTSDRDTGLILLLSC